MTEVWEECTERASSCPFGTRWGLATGTAIADVSSTQIYDDPEDERSWDRYGLKSAAMVVSCMSDDKDASAACLCEYMKGELIEP
jgi:hypothetical protein